MSDNHADGGTEPGTERKDNQQPHRKIPIPRTWRGVLALFFVIYGVITGSQGHWREWWVIGGLILACFFVALALHEFLHDQTALNGDNILFLSVGIPLLLAILIGFGYIVTWPVKEEQKMVQPASNNTTNSASSATSAKPRNALLIRAEGMPAGISYAPGTKVGGINWEKSDIPLKLHFTTAEREIRNINFKIMLDMGKAGIRAIGTLNSISQMVAVPTSQLNFDSPSTFTFLESTTNSQGEKIKQVVEPAAIIGPVWRVKFDSFPPNSITTILIAAQRANGSVPPNGIQNVQIEGTCEFLSQGVITNAPFRIGLYVTNN